MASIDGGMQDAALIKGRHGLLSLTGPSGDAHREPLDSVSGSPHSAQKTPLRRGFFLRAQRRSSSLYRTSSGRLDHELLELNRQAGPPASRAVESRVCPYEGRMPIVSVVPVVGMRTGAVFDYMAAVAHYQGAEWAARPRGIGQGSTRSNLGPHHGSGALWCGPIILLSAVGPGWTGSFA
jgi:hypothetical protein